MQSRHHQVKTGEPDVNIEMKTGAITLSLVALVGAAAAQQVVVPDPPEVRRSFVLTAAFDSDKRHNAFFYRGKTDPPTIRVLPGRDISLTYRNRLPVHSSEECALGPCEDHTNLHFHGMHVSPDRPQDDVLTMMAMPGQELKYRVEVPSYAAPGLYWYHTHPHGESARQDLDGMSGAIVVDGIDRYYPELRSLRERVLVIREHGFEGDSPEVRAQLLQRVDIPPERCGTSSDGTKVEAIFSINGVIRPEIPIAPGEKQFWRIVNASPNRYVDLQVEGQQLEVVALDGMSLSYHDRTRHTMKLDHVLVAPAGRVEAIVTSPAAGSHSTLSTRCVDTGVAGDNNPAMVIADVVSAAKSDLSSHKVPTTSGEPIYREFSSDQIKAAEVRPPDFTVIFTEDKNGFYINGKKFSMDSAPMVTVNIGSLQHWRVINATTELHPFHIHQVHFLAYAVGETSVETPQWLDTVNVPYDGGSVDLIMDFTDPIIRGMSVFHCHLLTHEDKGMMAKILFK
ncbi:MAG: multicopper oxidase family protein [Candidatus Korobacteraceae bacterium]